MRRIDDAGLTDALVTGDERAAEEMVRRHRPSMNACALSVLRDPHDAEDAVQSAMARAIAAIGRDRPRRLRPWLLAIARNEALILLRSRVPREALSPDLPAAGSVDGAFALREQVAGLVVDLRGLPDRQRSALVLRHLYEMSYRDIGELLGVRPATARQAVLQARRSLETRAQARAEDCGDIRLLLTGDGRARRAVAVRAHLEACAACRDAHPATLATRLRGLLPLPEPLLPPVLLRLLGGPGMSVRTGGGAAAACLCTFAIGLGLVDDAPRDGDRPSLGDIVPSVQPPGRVAVREAPRRPRRHATRRPAVSRPTPGTAPSAAVPAPHPVASAPARGDAPARTPSAAAPSGPAILPTGDEERTPHMTVEVLDDTSVTVWGYDVEMLMPAAAPLPVDPPIGPPGGVPDAQQPL